MDSTKLQGRGWGLMNHLEFAPCQQGERESMPVAADTSGVQSLSPPNRKFRARSPMFCILLQSENQRQAVAFDAYRALPRLCRNRVPGVRMRGPFHPPGQSHSAARCRFRFGPRIVAQRLFARQLSAPGRNRHQPVPPRWPFGPSQPPRPSIFLRCG
jgi:hypothetical protein